MNLIPMAEEAERAGAADEFRIISEAALSIFGWQDDRYKRVLRLLEAGASLDAAMTLVPEDWYLTGASEQPDGRFQFALFPRDIDSYDIPRTFEAHSAFLARCIGGTPALTLCAAALRALAHLKSKDNG